MDHQERKCSMITGDYKIRDVSCKKCDKVVGWFYEHSFNQTQRLVHPDFSMKIIGKPDIFYYLFNFTFSIIDFVLFIHISLFSVSRKDTWY